MCVCVCVEREREGGREGGRGKEDAKEGRAIGWKGSECENAEEGRKKTKIEK